MFEGSIRIYLPYIFQHIDVIVLKTLRFHPATRVQQSGYHRIRVDDRPNWTKKYPFSCKNGYVWTGSLSCASQQQT